MSRAHECPTCHGRREVDGQPCATCDAKGVVFEVEEAPDAPEGTLDLTDYGPRR